MRITAIRYHDFSYGHRVYNHESKCACLHGHNGRVTFHCEAEQLDSVGRVVDFSVIKQTLCNWVEENWDHRMLIWDQDPWLEQLLHIDSTVLGVSFNPTAENLASYLFSGIGPALLDDTGVQLVRVDFEETRKCSVSVDEGY